MNPALSNLLTLIKWVIILAFSVTTPYVAYRGIATFEKENYEKEQGQNFQLMVADKELNQQPSLQIFEKSNIINLPINSSFFFDLSQRPAFYSSL